MTELDHLCRAEWGHLLSALIRAVGDFDIAEEALQEAFAAAVSDWGGVTPKNAAGWLYATARHKAIDGLRRRSRFQEAQQALASQMEVAREAGPEGDETEETAVPDERLRLVFTCCHPALASEAQVALTLRTLCGLTTEEIARAFLVPTTTMAQRLVRAKGKIRAAGIPYRVPSPDELPARLGEVMSVIYLVFNEGYAAAQGQNLLRRELCAEAIRLARLVRAQLPRDPDLDALLALMLLQDARRAARVNAAGELVRLSEQDRSLWDRAQIDEGRALLVGALSCGPPGTYALEAAIAAVHADALRAEDTDWAQIAALYGRLLTLHPSPVVALNRAVAVGLAEGPAVALPLADALAEELSEYHLWHVTRADLLEKLGRKDEAIAAYNRAHALAGNEAERRFIAGQAARLVCK